MRRLGELGRGAARKSCVKSRFCVFAPFKVQRRKKAPLTPRSRSVSGSTNLALKERDGGNVVTVGARVFSSKGLQNKIHQINK